MNMRARFVILSLIVAYGGMGAPLAAQSKRLPAKVTAFIEQRDSCDHFRGEEAYDEERAAFLLERMKANCTGTDAALKNLRRRYARNPAVIAALRAYDWPIENGTPAEGSNK